MSDVAQCTAVQSTKFSRSVGREPVNLATALAKSQLTSTYCMYRIVPNLSTMVLK